MGQKAQGVVREGAVQGVVWEGARRRRDEQEGAAHRLGQRQRDGVAPRRRGALLQNPEGDVKMALGSGARGVKGVGNGLKRPKIGPRGG